MFVCFLDTWHFQPLLTQYSFYSQGSPKRVQIWKSKKKEKSLKTKLWLCWKWCFQNGEWHILAIKPIRAPLKKKTPAISYQRFSAVMDVEINRTPRHQGAERNRQKGWLKGEMERDRVEAHEMDNDSDWSTPQPLHTNALCRRQTNSFSAEWALLIKGGKKPCGISDIRFSTTLIKVTGIRYWMVSFLCCNLIQVCNKKHTCVVTWHEFHSCVQACLKSSVMKLFQLCVSFSLLPNSSPVPPRRQGVNEQACA